MWVPLGEISTIRTAIVFRDQPPKPAVNGNVRALTIKDVINEWPVNIDRLDRINVEETQIRNCLSPGEVIIPSRGDYYPSRHFRGSAEPIFPLGQLNLVCPSQKVISAYLSWYLNQSDAQNQIRRLLTGTSIKALTKPNLAAINVFVPHLETQHEIANLQLMWTDKKMLEKRLLELEEQEIEAICRRLVQHA